MFPLLSSPNVFRYSNKVITKLPDICRFITVFCYYCQRNIQRLINHIERAMQTLLCLAHCYHFWIRNKLLAQFCKWEKLEATTGVTAWLSQESVYQWMDFLSVAATWGSILISSYWFWQSTSSASAFCNFWFLFSLSLHLPECLTLVSD